MKPSLRSRGYLPHLEDREAVYFVTFRLADSLPKELVHQLRKERGALESAGGAKTAMPGDFDRLQELRALLRKAERCLDSGLGRCYLRDSRVAKIVVDSIRHFHGSHYQLFSWCVMPNHVHALFSPMQEHTLDSILHSWKSYSALEVNRILARTGRFWQREYFDHLVRSEASFKKFAKYIQDNPKRAGLVDWPWVGVL